MKKKPIFWIDMEMTGLDDQKDSILEVAVVITDQELNVLEKYDTVVFQLPEVVAGMNDWCKKTHGESGLTAAIPNGKSLQQVEEEVLALIGRHFSSGEKVVLAGNSVGNDRRFVDRYMPKMARRLHYRLIDVSSFKEIFRERYGLEFKKSDKHRASADIHESIAELAFYMSFVTVPAVNPGAAPAGGSGK